MMTMLGLFVSAAKIFWFVVAVTDANSTQPHNRFRQKNMVISSLSCKPHVGGVFDAQAEILSAV
jgi:hypothetical protein